METKQKRGLSLSAIVMIICTVVIVICVAWVTWNMGWIHIKTKAKMSMGDYSVIQVAESDVEVTDDEIDADIESFLTSLSVSEDVTEGTVEEGDVICISYVGTVDGEAFDGGTSDSSTITLGSSGYIDGFDEGLMGAGIGSTVVLNLTFPEDYSESSLAGADAVFTVDILYKTVTTTPELTDDLVAENSQVYFSEQIDTVDALKTFIHDYYYEDRLHSAMFSYLEGLETVKSYDEDDYALIYDYCMDELEYYASYYGYEADSMAALYGYTDAAAYCTDSTEYYLNKAMLLDYLGDKVGFSYSDDDINAAIQEYMDSYGYSDSYDVETFKENNGDAWLFLFTALEYKYTNVLPLLEDRVVFVSDEELAAEDATEDTEAESEGADETESETETE